MPDPGATDEFLMQAVGNGDFKAFEEIVRKNAQFQRRTVIALRRELMALLAAPGVAEKDIQSKQKEIMAAKRAMQDLVIGLLLREKKILNPEQFRELIKAIQQNCDCNGTKGSPRKGPGPFLSIENYISRSVLSQDIVSSDLVLSLPFSPADGW